MSCVQGRHAGLEVAVLWVAVDASEGLQHCVASGEDAVGEEEGVEEVNAEEAQVCESVQQTVHRRMADLSEDTREHTDCHDHTL